MIFGEKGFPQDRVFKCLSSLPRKFSGKNRAGMFSETEKTVIKIHGFLRYSKYNLIQVCKF